MTATADSAHDGVVVLGPAPPLRGGIAAHTARLVEHLHASGRKAEALSWRRLYPSLLFPGRSQREEVPRPEWVHEDLDVLAPWSARHALGSMHELDTGDATVVVQWWHPVVAATVLAAVRRVPPHRLVAVVHNARPHEWFPASGAALKALASRCGRVLCHGEAEAEKARELLGRDAAKVSVAPLPCLVSAADLEAGAARRPPQAAPGTRLFVAAGHQRGYKSGLDLAAAWTSARRPAGARLALVGEVYLGRRGRRDLFACCAKDPSIVLVDRYVDDAELVSWLAAAEVVLAPHARASQSGVLGIAAALGVPAIVSDAGSLAAQAAPGSSVVRAGDRAALRAALEHRFDLGLLADAGARRRRASAAAANYSGDWAAVVEAMGIAARP